jgi:hypothetical protein
MTHADTPARTGTASFKSVAQIYDSDDPSPEAHRDLSDTAENRIFRSVLAVPRGLRADLFDRLVIRVPGLAPGEDADVVSAVREHFLRRAAEVKDQTRLTVRTGLRECRLTFAVCVPSFVGIGICSQFKGDPLIEILENVLVIFCWVTIWQPFQSLVFDRWTEKVTAQIYTKIAGMPIEVSAG